MKPANLIFAILICSAFGCSDSVTAPVGDAESGQNPGDSTPIVPAPGGQKGAPKDLSLLLPPDDPSHKWGVLQGTDDAMLIVRRSTSAEEWKAHPGLPVSLRFAVPVKNLLDQAELDQLNVIEDTIVKEVGRRTPAVYALALTTATVKEFVFYIPEGVEIPELHEALQGMVKTHEVQCMAKKQPDWATYEQFSE